MSKWREIFIMKYLLSEYHCFMSYLMPTIYSDESAIKKYYKKKSGGLRLDLDHPMKFSEKQQWYKLNDRRPLLESCANKYSVRDYVISCGYKDILNDLIGVWENVDAINWDEMPQQFVLKATHGSGFNLIVKDKSEIKWNDWKKIFKSWMKQDISWSGREWVYKNMPRHIIAEKYLEDETGELRDFKFYCFNGQPKFMQLEVGRNTLNNTRNFYDTNWDLLPFGKELPHNEDIKVEKPPSFDQMLEISRDLSKPFSYVRADFYQVNGKVYFGELTFFPAGGAPDFIPNEYDLIVGEMWDIQELNSGDENV